MAEVEVEEPAAAEIAGANSKHTLTRAAAKEQHAFRQAAPLMSFLT
jgi:hypothetical protein